MKDYLRHVDDLLQDYKDVVPEATGGRTYLHVLRMMQDHADMCACA